MDKPKLIIIAGPTAIGKTDISVKLAKLLNTEIISADSMQIYKYMDIGSAKVSEDEKSGIPHHMIDFVEPWESFSVAEYKTMSEVYINRIVSEGKIPIIAGGTGLYIDSVISDFNFTDANKDEDYRKHLEQLADEKGNEFLFNILKEVDIKTANKLHPNNLKRIIRALEVYKITGKAFSEFELSNESKLNSRYALYYFVLTMSREVLYERINNRVDKMIDLGLIEEVKKLYSLGCRSYMQSMKGIGYKEILYYLEGNTSLDNAIDMIKQGSRNYAKRQLTWFRRDPRAIWIDKDAYQSDDEIVKFINNKII